MQLGNDYALGPINDKRALWCHERDFAHVNFFFLRSFLLAELKGYVERRAVSLTLALRFERGQLRLADFVMAEIEDGFFVVALNRENFPENGLEPVVLALGKWNVFLEKIDVGVELNLNQVWRLDGFLDCSEVDAFRISF